LSREIKIIADEFNSGVKILLRALEDPLRQIVKNAGKEEGAVVVNVVKNKASRDNVGYNAITNKIVDDMVEAGITDPVKVTRVALENAVSVSAILLTTEVAITDLPEKKDAMPMPPMGGGMPGGMGGMM